MNAPDLTQRPPRSPRVRLGGYALLPRMLDKGRATLAGKNGEYHYACPLDQRLLESARKGIAAIGAVVSDPIYRYADLELLARRTSMRVVLMSQIEAQQRFVLQAPWLTDA